MKIMEKIFAKKRTKKEEWSLTAVSAVSLAAGLTVLGLNFLLFSEVHQVYALVNMMAVLIILAMPLSYRYNSYKSVKRIEEMFPRYLRDLAENISTGMTLPQAMRTAANNDYDVLTPHVKALAAKVDWGISLEKALYDFAKRTGSKTMRRNVQTIIEAHRSGGTIDTILKSVAGSLQELEKIKKERSASIYAQMVNGYMIYIVFLGVMIGLSTILVPAFSGFGGGAGDLQGTFVTLFRSLTVIQGFFAGVSIGKMAEGTVTAGIKHALALTIFGYSVFIIFA